MVNIVKQKSVVLRPVTAPGFVNVTKAVPLKTKNIAMRVFELAPGGYTDLHAHQHVHLNYVLYGTVGIFTTNRDKPSYILNAGDVCSIDAQATHRYKNIGDTPCRFICVTEASAEK